MYGFLSRDTRLPPFSVACLFALLLVCGACNNELSVTRYTVDKTLPPRVLVATVEVDGLVWFFKLSGASDGVAAHREDFHRFLDSVKFGKPGEATCPTPKGWDTSSRGMQGSFKRFKSLAIPTDTEILDVSVSFLRAPATGIDDEYLKTNLDRWRKQIKLGPISDKDGDDWKDVLSAISIDGVPGLLADITGLVNQHFTPPRPPASASTGPMTEPRFEYSVPDDWTNRGASAFVAQTWTVGENEDAVKISLSFAGGELEDNVNRWRDQVGLGEVASSQFESVEVDGQAGKLFDLVGESRRVIGIVVPQTRLSLFIKMTGPVDKVEVERAGFRAFVQSLKLK